jgi:hypothetical protein
VRQEDRVAISNTITRLHIHAGVRRDDLGDTLALPVRAAWHITDGDTVETVRAKAIGQVRRVLNTLTSVKHRLVAEVLLNLSYDVELCADRYDERRSRLARYASGYSPATTYRILQKTVQPALLRALQAPVDVLSPPDLEHIKVAERKLLALLPTDALRRNNRPTDEQITRFMANDVYLSRPTAPGTFTAVDIPGHGKWIKVFTSINKLAMDLAADTGEWLSLSAADLVQSICATGEPLGLLVDPHVGEVLYLNPDIVRELAGRER